MSKRYKEATEHFENILLNETEKWPDQQWCGEIDHCDVCSRPMACERFMIDGPAQASAMPMWGNICVICAKKYSPQIGWGVAQLYEQQTKGVWRLVSGGLPKS